MSFALSLAGAVVSATAFFGYTGSPPRSKAIEMAARIAVGIFPASIVLATPTLGIGLVLSVFRATRGSVVLTMYSAAYLLGLLLGAGLLLARSN